MFEPVIRFEENDPDSCQRHRSNEKDLDPTQDILDPNSRTQEDTVDDRDGREQADRECLLLILRGSKREGKETVLAKNNAVAGCES